MFIIAANEAWLILAIPLGLLGIILFFATIVVLGDNNWHERGFWRTMIDGFRPGSGVDQQAYQQNLDEQRRRTYESNQNKPDFLPKDPRP